MAFLENTGLERLWGHVVHRLSLKADKEDLKALSKIVDELPQSDWNQNDETQLDYVKNRPFGERIVMGDTLTWDGNIEGLTKAGEDMFLVSDVVPNVEDLKNGIVEQFNNNGNIYTYTYSAGELSIDEGVIEAYDSNHTIITKDNVEWGGRIYPKKGIYFRKQSASYCQSITINGFERTEINHLDPKYIKDMYYTSDPVETPIVEETTFELVDGMGQLTATQPLEVGQEYVINLDSVQYNAMCKEINLDGMALSYLGNLVAPFPDSGVDTGEPFFVAPINSDTELGIMVNGDVTEHTVSIIGNIVEINHLDPKYIKDMYYEYIAPNTDVVLDAYLNAEEDNWWFGTNDFYLESFLVEGATYIATCNNETYTCTARRSNDGEVYIGNQAVAGWGEDAFSEIIESNEPFFLYTLEEYFDYELCMQTAGEYNIVIQGTGEKLTPHKIDMKYMPDSITHGMRNQWNEINNIHNRINTISDSKMDKENPTGTGSFSMNRKAGTTVGNYSHAEGFNTTASGQTSHAEGGSTTASGGTSHAEGRSTTASGTCSHAEGELTTASGMESHAEGSRTTASGYNSHAEGQFTKATKTDDAVSTTTITHKGYHTHAEGYGTVAYGAVSHAEGNGTKASGTNSHSEGCSTVALGDYSHSEGYQTAAGGESSHAEGYCTSAAGGDQHVQGRYNIENIVYAHIVGNGSSSARSNAHTLDWDGNAWFAGDVYVGSTSGTNRDEGSKKLATTEDINFDELTILAESGVADITANENNEILTDENNIIYVL